MSKKRWKDFTKAEKMDQATSIAKVGQGKSLDQLVDGAVNSHLYRENFSIVGGEVGDALALKSLENRSPDYSSSGIQGERAAEAFERQSREVAGNLNTGAEVASGEGANSAVHMVQDLYLSTTKMYAAWTISNGIGKDTKAMIQQS